MIKLDMSCAWIIKQISTVNFSQLETFPREYVLLGFGLGALSTFMLGACTGSFLSVCVWRLPREESILWPPSACPNCGRRLRFFENIPILGWLFLRGKCRGCKTPISFRYIFLELFTAMLFTGIWIKVVVLREPFIFMLPLFAMTMLIVCTCFIDSEHRIIPDETTYPAMGTGLVLAFLIPTYWGVSGHWLAFSYSCASLTIAAGGMALFAILGKFIFKQEALGWGDVKYLGAAGALLGPAACFFTVLAGALAGSIAGMTMMLSGKAKAGSAIPFGPYLAIASYLWMMFGTWLLKKYLALAAAFHSPWT